MITPGVAAPPDGKSSIRVLPVIATLVVAFLLALVALIAMGPFNSDHPILGRFLADASSSQDAAKGTADEELLTKDELTQETPASETTDTSGQPDSQAPPKSKSDAGAGQATESGASPAGADAAHQATEPEATVPPPPDAGSGAGAADSTSESPARSSTFPLPPKNTSPAQPAARDVAADTDSAAPPAPAPVAPAPADAASPTRPSDATPPAGPMDSDTSTAAPPKPAAEGTEAAGEPEPLAHASSDLHVLAGFDPASETWVRLPPNAPLTAGQKLVALPTYRPQIALNNGIQLTLVGPAAISLIEPDSSGIPGILVRYGGILAVGSGKTGTALNIRIGERQSRAVFQDLDSTLALEVQRYLPPGSNPEEVAAHRLVRGIATAGRLIWEADAEGESKIIETGQQVAMIDDSPPKITAVSPPPDWLDPKNLRPIDRDASKQLQGLLDSERPVTTSLSEQVSSRLVEVRALAIRSLALLDIYDPFVTALNSKDLRSFWPDLFNALQGSIARDAATAALVHSTFQRLRGDTGTQLYRLLWGYSPEQLAAGEAEALVKMLSNDSMDIRVLAFENLTRIAGKTNSYHPEVDPARQKRAILNWERDAKQDGITYKTPPLELSGD